MDVAMDYLMELGYNFADALDALNHCGGNLEEALEFLVKPNSNEQQGASNPVSTFDDELNQQTYDMGPEVSSEPFNTQLVTKQEEASAGKVVNLNTRLQIRLPTGKTVVKVLGFGTPLQVVREFVLEQPGVESNFEMGTAWPRKQFTQVDSSSSLVELGLVPSATVIVTNIKSPEDWFKTSSGVFHDGGANMAKRDKEREARDKEIKEQKKKIEQQKKEEEKHKAAVLQQIEDDKQERKYKFQYQK